MIHLKSVSLKSEITEHYYPFNLQFIRNFKEFQFKKPVTIFIRENGTGKSTFLESIASNIGRILIGGENIEHDPHLAPARELSNKLKLTWTIKTKKGFFFRANDFINFTHKLDAIKQESIAKIKEIESKGKFSYEVVPYKNTVGALNQLYGNGLEVRSHGESFLDLFQARFTPNGLYLLDEPEAPLSPLKQLSLISLINDMVKENGQFIIATHSPILMAIPDADLYVFDNDTLINVNYDDIEHVKLTKDFLNNPERYLRHL